MTKQSNYTADSIISLEGLEAIRHRPGMYVGQVSSSNPDGLFRLAREGIDNVCDEWLAGHNNVLIILYDSKTNIVTLIDHGRGIPTEKKKNGDYALTDAVTKIHAGGKFNTDVYKVSSGLNGVGLKAMNALSTHFKIWSNSGKGWYSQQFSEGKKKTEVVKDKPIKYLKYVSDTGVVVEYKPDAKIFVNSIKLNVSRLKRELSDIQYLCPKLKIKLFVDGELTKYYSEEGLKEMIYREGIVGKPFSYQSKNLEVALNWVRNQEDIKGNSISSFVNISYTNEGGTHVDGLRRVISKCLREYTKEKVELEDLLEGLIGAIHWKMKDPTYTGQTKNKLTNDEVTKEVYDQLEQPLRSYFAKNKNLTDTIVKYAEKMLEEREKLKNSSAVLKGIDKLVKTSKNIPDKFTDADRRKHKNAKDIELYICEGDSAGGHFIHARESFQACLKIRGKIINAARATPTELFGGIKSKKGKKGEVKKTDGNKEIKDLVTVLGCGIEPKFDITKLRFGKVILLMDADTDGSHIKNLVLSFIVNYMPELVKQGYIFVVDAPLFVGTSVNEVVYGKTRNEIDIKMKNKNIKKYNISRLKGWGECSENELSTLCLNPNTRKLIQLKWSDDAESTIRQMMGDDVTFRKELLGVR